MSIISFLILFSDPVCKRVVSLLDLIKVFLFPLPLASLLYTTEVIKHWFDIYSDVIDLRNESVKMLVQLCPTLCDSIDSSPCQAPLSTELSRQDYWSG